MDVKREKERQRQRVCQNKASLLETYKWEGVMKTNDTAIKRLKDQTSVPPVLDCFGLDGADVKNGDDLTTTSERFSLCPEMAK